MHKTRILLVSSPAFSRIIEHLFRGRPEFEVVGALNDLGGLGQQAGRLLPELIVANVKPVSTKVCQVIAFIKQASPSSKLILICPVEELVPLARKCGADACLKGEKVAAHLLRAAHNLADRPRLANGGN